MVCDCRHQIVQRRPAIADFESSSARTICGLHQMSLTIMCIKSLLLRDSVKSAGRTISSMQAFKNILHLSSVNWSCQETKYKGVVVIPECSLMRDLIASG